MLIHNQYSDLLKSFKFFLSLLYDDVIQEYIFNYGSKTILQHKLYEDQTLRLPKATIELMQIVAANQNHGRYFYDSRYNFADFISICHNESKNQAVKCGMRWYNMQFEIKIQCQSQAEMLNMMNRVTSALPLNMMCFPFSYYNFIELPEESIKGWDFLKDNIKNIYLLTDQNIDQVRNYAQVYHEPIIIFNGVNGMPNPNDNTHEFNISISLSQEFPYCITTTRFEEPIIGNILMTIDNNDLKALPVMNGQNNYYHADYENALSFFIIEEQINVEKNSIKIPNNWETRELLALSSKVSFYYIEDTSKLKSNMEQTMIAPVYEINGDYIEIIFPSDAVKLSALYFNNFTKAILSILLLHKK